MNTPSKLIVNLAYAPPSSRDHVGSSIKVGIISDFIISTCSFATLISDTNPTLIPTSTRTVTIAAGDSFTIEISGQNTSSNSYGMVNIWIKSAQGSWFAQTVYGSNASSETIIYSATSVDAWIFFVGPLGDPFVLFNSGELFITAGSAKYPNGTSKALVTGDYGYLAGEKAAIVKPLLDGVPFGEKIYGISNNLLSQLGLSNSVMFLRDENNNVWFHTQNILLG